MRATLLIAVASTLALAACSEKQTTQLQESASSAIGTVHNSLQDSSAPLGQLRNKPAPPSARPSRPAPRPPR